MSERRFATPKQIPEIYGGAFNSGNIRYYIMNRKENGFEVCIKRCGKKILIDLDEFEKWIDSRKPKDWE